MAKKRIPTKSPNNSIEIITRGVTRTAVIKANEPFDIGELQFLNTETKLNRNHNEKEQMLRGTIIAFMHLLKNKGYPYRPNYKIASNNKTGNICLTDKLKAEWNLKPLDTYYVIGEVVHGYYMMKLRQSMGATTEELINHAFKIGNNHQKALMLLKETNINTRVSRQPRADQEIEKKIGNLAKTNMTAMDVFTELAGHLEATEREENGSLYFEYLDRNDCTKTITLKTIQNKLSRLRKRK